MSRAQPSESHDRSGVRGVASAAPRPTPLTMVSAAVAGDDLQSVAASAAGALRRPVAIALPALGAPVVWPANGAGAEELRELAEYAAGVMAGGDTGHPAPVADWVPVRIGRDVAGVVAALGPERFEPEQRPWLEA